MTPALLSLAAGGHRLCHSRRSTLEQVRTLYELLGTIIAVSLYSAKYKTKKKINVHNNNSRISRISRYSAMLNILFSNTNFYTITKMQTTKLITATHQLPHLLMHTHQGCYRREHDTLQYLSNSEPG